MSRGIIGITVGTTISPAGMERKMKPVKTVNGTEPDENGNVDVGLTGEEKAEIVDAVLAALHSAEGVGF